MNKVLLHKQEFTITLTHNEICERIAQLSKDIKSTYIDELPVFVVVMNGAMRFADALMGNFSKPLYTDYIQVSSYSGEVSGKIELLTLPKLNMNNRHVLLVEDIVDTGKTLDFLLKSPAFKEAKSIKVASLLHKPNKNKSGIHPDFCGFEIDDAFVVGFGLDYDQLGRNLNNIYKKQ